MYFSVNVAGVCVLREAPTSSTMTSITSAALQGSDVHSTHLTTNKHERSWDTSMYNTLHMLTHGEETEREAISSVSSHAEWFTVMVTFLMMVPCSFLHFFSFLSRTFGLCEIYGSDREGKVLVYKTNW